MTYQCRCDDGPARGTEFWDYGPPVRVGVPHGGRILEYRLLSVLDNCCTYQFLGPAEEAADR